MGSKSDKARSESERNRRNLPLETTSSIPADAASERARGVGELATPGDKPAKLGDEVLDADVAIGADRASADLVRADLVSGDPVSADPVSAEHGRVDPDTLQRLVKRAVAESLHPATRGAPRSQVVLDATAKLERLLAQYGDIEGLRQRLAEQRDALGIELSRLRSAVVARRGFLEAESDVSVWPVDPERWRTLRWRVQARLSALADSAADAGADLGTVAAGTNALRVSPLASSHDSYPAGAARLAAQEVLDLFAKERAASLAELRRRSDAEVVQLERRLSALASTVEQAERVLEVLREAPLESGGVASYFREPEGLDPEARNREMKLALLDGVFRQNIELQRGGE